MRLVSGHFNLRRAFAGGLGCWRSGVSLVELMIALSILTIGVVGLMGSFQFIQKAVQISKNKTLASNLAQEKMQILKEKSYYQVLVTSDPEHNTTDFAPESVDYDPGYFPPEEIMEGGVKYTRYTYVQAVREDSGVIGALAPNIPDTGMKRITVTVTWGYGSGKRKVTVRSIMANPDTVMTNVIINGLVQSTSSVAIGGALVQLVEGSGWSDTTNPSGQYSINATPGTYTLMASATGYNTSMHSILMAAGNTVPYNFQLWKTATGRITGYPWRIDHLVISQVVGSTVDASVTPSFDQEYVEVFNPSTYTWNMGDIGLKFQRASDSTENTILIRHLYPVPTVPSGGYYLFANTGTVVAGGAVVEADAVWTNGNSYFPYFAAHQGNIIPVVGDDGAGGSEGGGAIKLYRISDAAVLDEVGWNKTGHPAPFYENTAVISQPAGLSRNELYARITSTGDALGVNWNYGPAYDSNNNSFDFHDYSTSVSFPPHSSDSGVKTVISGTPAVGAVVSCTDGLSSSTEAVTFGSPPVARFSLVDVATGDWKVLITSGNYSLVTATFTMTSGSNYIFVSSSTLLTGSNINGVITGRVIDVNGAALNLVTVASGGANSTTTGNDGRYWLTVAPGMADITVNPSAGGGYVTASSNTIPVDAGEVHAGVDFVLYRGGRVRGFVTMDGSHGLPGVAVAILDANSIARDQQVSGTDGWFTSVVLSTGYYIVQPVIGALESSTPVSSTVTILGLGDMQGSSTFTITGVLGYITGSVKHNNKPINSGVLIVVTTTTLPVSGATPVPPNLSSSTLAGPPYYLVSSMENGTYLAEVRNGSQYNVYAYYPEPSGNSAIIHSSTTVHISVGAGQTTPGVNFSW